MNDIKLYNIQLIDIELFLKVAECGSFTQAGNKLFMTQSWVSKRISVMENELQLQLFIRDKRSVTLTPAGQVLRDRLSSVNEQILHAISAAHAVQTGITGMVKIGFLEWGCLKFLDRINSFSEENKQIAIESYCQHFTELHNSITNNTLDLVFTTSYDCSNLNAMEYNFINLEEVPLVAYMSKKNPLAEKEEVSVADLRAEALFMLEENASVGYCTYVKELFAQHNIRPLIAQYAKSGGEHIGGLLLNKGILLASSYFLDSVREDQIARVPVKDAYISIVGVWRKHNQNPALQKLVDYLLESTECYEEDN